MVFQDAEAQKQHFNDEHECQFCDGSFMAPCWYFEDPDMKKKHNSEKHATCDSCGDVFEYKFEINYHMEEKHKAANKALVGAINQ